MTEPVRYACTVVRAPGAPPRRAGLVWPEGVTDAVLTGAQMDLIEADPGYAVGLVPPHITASDAPALPANAEDGVAVSGYPAQGVPAPAVAKARQRKLRS